MSCVDKKELLLSKLRYLGSQAAKEGLSRLEIHKVMSRSESSDPMFRNATVVTSLDNGNWWPAFRYTAVITVLAIFIAFSYQTMDPKCIISNNLLMLELARPAVSCDVCRNMDSVPTVDGSKMSKDLFMKNYAYNGIPLLVKGGAKNWTALDTFSFKYLKDLFELTEGALDAVQFDCQYFAYKTNFLSMAEVFNMSEARSRFEAGQEPWYVGWSNCHPDVAKQLRKHYKTPEFLPDDSESSNLDWLFMGGFGGGANIHIDYVQRPSWQAMIAGKKSWKLIPSPECDSVCKTLNATMEKGDIILVDTNMWYHSTYIHPGEMSITIGSEYD